MSKFEYPPVGFRFSVTIGGKSGTDASFAEVSGISAELKVEEVIDGGENRFSYRLPTQISYAPLLLKRGIAGLDSPLLKWVSNTFSYGLAVPLTLNDVVVSLLNESNEPLISWKFEDAFPVKYDISGLKADANQVAIESIELSYKRFYSL